MSTRSLIGIQNQNLSIQYIYCHFDGHLSKNGKILLENYLEGNLREVLNEGDISGLSNVPSGCEHYYDKDSGGVCESLLDFKYKFKTDLGWINYAYLFQVRKRRWSYLTQDHETLRFLTPKKIRLSIEEQEAEEV